jgi:hypothetical protein
MTKHNYCFFVIYEKRAPSEKYPMKTTFSIFGATEVDDRSISFHFHHCSDFIGGSSYCQLCSPPPLMVFTETDLLLVVGATLLLSSLCFALLCLC